MIKKTLALLLVFMLVLSGCTSSPEVSPIKTISASEALSMYQQDSDLLIIDVRTVAEFKEGHIPNSINVPLDVIGNQIGSIVPNKDDQIVIVCRSGNRSAQAANILKDMGYTNIIDMGGILSWNGPVQLAP